MTDQQGANPIELLVDIERRARANAAGLPQQQDIREQWSGIGFRLGERWMLAPLDEVTELLTLPVMTRVPGAKSWVLGIANVRGNLLPIMDLNGYLYGRRTVVGKRTRILVINHRGVFAGLLVDEVTGLRHFDVDRRLAARPDSDVETLPYLERGFELDGRAWPVFSMRKLAESPLFMQVAV